MERKLKKTAKVQRTVLPSHRSFKLLIIEIPRFDAAKLSPVAARLSHEWNAAGVTALVALGGARPLLLRAFFMFKRALPINNLLFFRPPSGKERKVAADSEPP